MFTAHVRYNLPARLTLLNNRIMFHVHIKEKKKRIVCTQYVSLHYFSSLMVLYWYRTQHYARNLVLSILPYHFYRDGLAFFNGTSGHEKIETCVKSWQPFRNTNEFYLCVPCCCNEAAREYDARTYSRKFWFSDH